MSKMPNEPTVSTDYELGYRAGIADASQAVADFYFALKVEDAKIICDLSSAQAAVHAMLLQRLYPLQDKVRSLRLGGQPNAE